MTPPMFRSEDRGPRRAPEGCLDRGARGGAPAGGSRCPPQDARRGRRGALPLEEPPGVRCDGRPSRLVLYPSRKDVSGDGPGPVAQLVRS